MNKSLAPLPVVLLAVFFGLIATTDRVDAAQAVISPVELRCEYLKNPLGIDEAQPRLNWRLDSSKPAVRGQRQSAYQVLVAASGKALHDDKGDLWDSGKVMSDQSLHVAYAGKPLVSQQRCWWKVRVWDEAGLMSSWSVPASWTMGLLQPEDWSPAKWVGLDEAADNGIETADIKTANWLWYPEGQPAQDAPVGSRYFRRTLVIPSDRRIRQAICFFAGDDQCTLYVNGTLIGTGNGHPNLVGAELTDQLQPGTNQLAVIAVNSPAQVPANPAGWIGVVRVDYETGPSQYIRSDGNWKCARTVEDGWLTSGYDDSQWVPAMNLGQAGIAPWGTPWPDRWHTEHRRLPARYLRRDFAVPEKKLVRATAYICGLGFFDLYVNGHLIGDQLMNPALTGYDKRALYVTFDLTSQIRSGSNAVGLVLSNGRFFAPRFQVPIPMHSYGYPKAIGKIVLEFSDGSQQTIATDESWKVTADGPIRASNEYDGEEYDALREFPGWSQAGFDDSRWQPAGLVESPGGRLQAQMLEPIRVTQVLKPVRLLQPKPGIWMVDFGQAFYGVVQLKVSGAAGTRVILHTSFNVLPDGTLKAVNDRSALNRDVYILKGTGTETWHPRFRGNATRWMQVEGFPGTPGMDTFTGLVVHTDFKPVGEFECANDLVNHVYQNARWGTRMQDRSVPMEPDRDERMPWSGHPAKTSESEGWEFNVACFYRHFLSNYRAHQAEDGSLQEILPPYWMFNSRDIIWPSVATIIPDWLYNFYGDDQPLRENYDMLKRFVLYHEKANLKADGTTDNCTYGDWVDTESIGANSRNPGATSHPLMGTAYFYNNCRILQRAARILGKPEDEQYFRALADRVYAGFNQRFFDPQSQTYESKTQCSDVLPLAFGLVPAEHRDAVIHHLVNDIMVTHHGHTSVGLIGMQWEMQVLTAIGHPEAAWQIITRTDRPSWGYMVSKGGTTSWERWDTDTQDGGMNGESQKILSGNLEAWCYQTLGGINYDLDQPGFKHILLRPQPVGDLKWVKTSFQSLYGKIRSDWTNQAGKFQWKVTVPLNTTATVYVPTRDPASVMEGGHPAAASAGVKFLRMTDAAAVYEVESGHYKFASSVTSN